MLCCSQLFCQRLHLFSGYVSSPPHPTPHTTHSLFLSISLYRSLSPSFSLLFLSLSLSLFLFLFLFLSFSLTLALSLSLTLTLKHHHSHIHTLIQQLLVPPKLLGTAFGLAGVLFTTGLLIFPVAVGTLRTQTGSFMWPMLILAFINIFGTAINFLLKYYDLQNGSLLESPLAPSKTSEEETSLEGEGGQQEDNWDGSATPSMRGLYNEISTPKISPKTNPVRRLHFERERVPLKDKGRDTTTYT